MRPAVPLCGMEATSRKGTIRDRRFAAMPRREVAGIEVPVADSHAVRFLGLAHLDRDLAGPGLLIPRCRSVHTFGMRFEIDIWFLDGAGDPVMVRRGVPSRRLLWCLSAAAVLEVVPVEAGGEN